MSDSKKIICNGCKVKINLQDATQCKFCISESEVKVSKSKTKKTKPLLYCQICINSCYHCNESGCNKCIDCVCGDCCVDMCPNCSGNGEPWCGCYGSCSKCRNDVNRGKHGRPCRSCRCWYCDNCRGVKNYCKECGLDENENESESESEVK